MGCNCGKNKVDTSKVKVQQTEDKVIEIIDIPAPPYTIEDVIRIKDYYFSTNKTETEKQFVADILLRSFGDIIPSYCDQVCLRQIKTKADYMEQKIIEYNKSK
jgi:hypothetical protein